jgi:hypothetical protein
MPTIGNNLLPYPNTSDEPNMPKAISDLASAVDSAIGGGARIYQTLAALQAVPSSQLFEGLHAYVSADTTATNNGGYTYTSGTWKRSRPYMQAGAVNSKTDVNGYVSVSFPSAMDVAPTAVLVTNGPAVGGVTSQYADLSLGQVDATHFTVFSRNTTSGGAMGNNPAIFQWLAIWL